jgi:hypothetical protein
VLELLRQVWPGLAPPSTPSTRTLELLQLALPVQQIQAAAPAGSAQRQRADGMASALREAAEAAVRAQQLEDARKETSRAVYDPSWPERRLSEPNAGAFLANQLLEAQWQGGGAAQALLGELEALLRAAGVQGKEPLVAALHEMAALAAAVAARYRPPPASATVLERVQHHTRHALNAVVDKDNGVHLALAVWLTRRMGGALPGPLPRGHRGAARCAAGTACCCGRPPPSPPRARLAGTRLPATRVRALVAGCWPALPCCRRPPPREAAAPSAALGCLPPSPPSPACPAACLHPAMTRAQGLWIRAPAGSGRRGRSPRRSSGEGRNHAGPKDLSPAASEAPAPQQAPGAALACWMAWCLRCWY